jgi:hypothetical protein
MTYRIESPCPDHRLPQVLKWTHDFWDQMMDDFTPKTIEEITEMNQRDIANGSLQYFFSSHDGNPLGVVWGVNGGDQVFIGHLVFEREGVSTAEKLDMARIALGKMFESGARKIVWQLYADNRAFRIFLKKIGAEQEGYLKQGARRNGELVDTILMASFAKGNQ